MGFLQNSVPPWKTSLSWWTTSAPPESWASGSVRGVVFDDLGIRAPVAYWEQLGDHALACFQGRGQDLDSVLVPASLDHPLGCHQVLQDGVTDLERLRLAVGGFLEATALLLFSQGAHLTSFYLVRGPTEQHPEQQQPRGTSDPTGGVDVSRAVRQFEDREQGETDARAHQTPAQPERHGQEGDRQRVEDVDSFSAAVAEVPGYGNSRKEAGGDEQRRIRMRSVPGERSPLRLFSGPCHLLASRASVADVPPAPLGTKVPKGGLGGVGPGPPCRGSDVGGRGP